MNKSRVAQFTALGIAVAAGAFVGFTVVTNNELRTKLIVGVKKLFKETKSKAEVVSEEVALRTAKLTNNPKVNQDWVSNQWDSIGC